MKFPRSLSHRGAVILMIVVTFLWSIAGAVTKQLESARSFEVTFWRSFFTVLSLLAILVIWQGPRVIKRTDWNRGSFWVSGVCWSVMFTAFMVALTLTSVGNVLVTMATGPLLTALIARVFIGHQLPKRTWAAIAVAGAGMLYMFGQQFDLQQPGVLMGMMVAFCVPIAGAIHWTVVQRAQARGYSIDFVPCVLVGGLISTLVTFPLSFPMTATVSDIAWLGFLGLFQLAIPCTLAVICAQVLKAPEVSLLALLEVIFGILMAWWFAAEVPPRPVLIGAMMVIGALLANEWLAWCELSAVRAKSHTNEQRAP
jgi:drug/metabolite transporter (DMT)-like permease